MAQSDEPLDRETRRSWLRGITTSIHLATRSCIPGCVLGLLATGAQYLYRYQVVIFRPSGGLTLFDTRTSRHAELTVALIVLVFVVPFVLHLACPSRGGPSAEMRQRLTAYALFVGIAAGELASWAIPEPPAFCFTPSWLAGFLGGCLATSLSWLACPPHGSPVWNLGKPLFRCSVACATYWLSVRALRIGVGPTLRGW